MFSIIRIEQHRKGNKRESKMLRIYSFETSNVIILPYFVYTVAFTKKIFSYLILGKLEGVFNIEKNKTFKLPL